MQTDTVVAIPADAVARDALLRRLGALARVDHPAVEPVGAAVARPDGTLVVPRGAAHATDLATVLSVRGRCAVAEASGLAVDVARALAALHSEGVAQGPIGPADVVIGLDGRACLRPRLDLPPPGTGEADDVHALARLVEDVVGPQDGDDLVALHAALAPALADDARVRPEAGTLAARVHDAVGPEPVRLPEPAVLAAAALARRPREPEAPAVARRPARRATSVPVLATRSARRGVRRSDPRRGRVPRWGRVVGGVVGVGAVVGVLVVTGMHLTSVHPGPPPVTAAVESAPTVPAATDGAAPASAPVVAQTAAPVLDRSDPEAAAAELTRRRIEMLAGTLPVDDVVAAGSPAHRLASDERARVEATGLVVRGAQVEVTDVRRTTGPAAQDAVEAEVEVVYVVGAHEQVGEDGSVAEVPRGDEQTDVLRLAWTEDGWRVTDVW